MDPLSSRRAALLIVDVQDRLAAAMPEEARDQLERNVVVLIVAARRFGLPIVVSEQYPKGLGRTVPNLAAALEAGGGEVHRIEKLEFSVCDNADFAAQRKALGRDQWLVTGMETHVCVLQSVKGLIGAGAEVHVVADAVASRTEDNRRIGLHLAERAGAIVTSTETVVFELLQKAGTDDFKALSKLIK
jgi:nicotinamidase-related amidase